jgi:lactate dehydrogenase-like 2-hydroxyacid dehydrogenase
MATAISTDAIDLLVYGPVKPVINSGFAAPFVAHTIESKNDLTRLTDEVAARIRGIAVTGLVATDSSVLARFPKLEMVASFGVGYDHVDSAYARDHGIVVTHTPDVLTEEVADTALGLLIATLREFVRADRYLRSGQWETRGDYPLTRGSLRGRTVGIVGLGRIGKAVARRLDAMQVPVVFHSRRPAECVPYKHYPNLLYMARVVETLIVITPGGAATRHLINAEVLQALGPEGVVVNVARGTVIDEAALIAALKDGTILGAGLDVFEREPKVPDELRALPNTVLLPHMGSASVVTRRAMEQLVVDNLKAWFAGKAPLTPIPETPVKGR